MGMSGFQVLHYILSRKSVDFCASYYFQAHVFWEWKSIKPLPKLNGCVSLLKLISSFS